MLLQKLVEYSQRDPDLLPPGYNKEPVRYWIELNDGGDFLGMVASEDEGGRVKRVPVPTLVRSSSIKPKLFADNAEYVFGLLRDGSKAERVREAHRRFLDLAERCRQETDEPAVDAVVRFLERYDTSPPPLPDDFDPSGIIGFRVDGVPVTDLSAVREFWLHAAVGDNPVEMECLVCGRRRPAMERIQLRLKGIPGGQTSGLALISANADAFESQGLSASYTAPTCQDCSDRFMKAANSLISGDSTHVTLDDLVYIFWARDEPATSWGNLLSNPQPEDVKRLLESVHKGGAGKLDPEPFYAAALSASGARAVVRDWIDTTVGHAQEQLAAFFEHQALPDE